MASSLSTLAAVVVIGLFVLPAAPAASGLPPELVLQVKDETARISDDLIEIRRRIHMYPELAGQEEGTAALIAERLVELGLDVRTGVGGHGVVGILRGARPGPVVAYRADMDAVASAVIGDPPYRSRVQGVKHVCGHDAHVAIGLGIAEVLTGIREEVPGTVKFLFQPAEETVEGALAMIADGALVGPAPEALFAVHTTPLPAGVIFCPAGVGLSGVQSFVVRIAGTGGPDSIAAAVVEAVKAVSTVSPLQGPEGFAALAADILREDSSYREYVYVHVTAVEGTEDGATIQGMLRASSDRHYDSGEEQIREAVLALAGEGVTIEVDFPGDRMPNMNSDAELVLGAMGPIEAVLGPGSAVPVHASIPFFGEDFAYFQQHVPGAMFYLGVQNTEKGITAFNHFPDYDLDESAIGPGTAAMAAVLLDYLLSHERDVSRQPDAETRE